MVAPRTDVRRRFACLLLLSSYCACETSHAPADGGIDSGADLAAPDAEVGISIGLGSGSVVISAGPHFTSVGGNCCSAHLGPSPSPDAAVVQTIGDSQYYQNSIAAV